MYNIQRDKQPESYHINNNYFCCWLKHDQKLIFFFISLQVFVGSSCNSIVQFSKFLYNIIYCKLTLHFIFGFHYKIVFTIPRSNQQYTSLII